MMKEQCRVEQRVHSSGPTEQLDSKFAIWYGGIWYCVMPLLVGKGSRLSRFCVGFVESG